MRRAQPSDIPVLVALMTEFYAESGFPLDQKAATRSFADILGDERLGYVWMIEAEGKDAGHVVVTVRYAMEYGGLIGCLDDLYVRPSWRNRGLSTSALAEIAQFCGNAGLRALTVSVTTTDRHAAFTALRVLRKPRIAFCSPYLWLLRCTWRSCYS